MLYGSMVSHKQTQQQPRYNIEFLDKIVRLIETLRDAPAAVTLQEMAVRTGYGKSSIHRTLARLKRHGYVEQLAPGGPYHLGIKCLLLVRAWQDGVELVRHARSFLREMVDLFDESAYLSVLRDGRVVFVEMCDARRHELRVVRPLGAEATYHAGAAGKLFAAHLPPPARTTLLSRIQLTAQTPWTRTRPAEVEAEWDRVARRRVAINHEETVVGAIFLAAPIFDAERTVCGAITLGIPKARYTAALRRRVTAGLKEICERLSDALAEARYVHPDRELRELR